METNYQETIQVLKRKFTEVKTAVIKTAKKTVCNVTKLASVKSGRHQGKHKPFVWPGMTNAMTLLQDFLNANKRFVWSAAAAVLALILITGLQKTDTAGSTAETAVTPAVDMPYQVTVRYSEEAEDITEAEQPVDETPAPSQVPAAAAEELKAPAEDKSNTETEQNSVAAQVSAAKTTTGTAVSGPLTVTKNPTDETVKPGGSAEFIAHCDNDCTVIWRIQTPDIGITYTVKDINTKFQDLQVSGGGTDTLILKNIPADMDGWHVQAKFLDAYGNAKYSGHAKITVESEQAEKQNVVEKASETETGTVASPKPTAASDPTVTATPVYGGQINAGSFLSNTGYGIELKAVYTVTTLSADYVTVKIDTYLVSSTLSAIGSQNSLIISAGSQKTYAGTQTIQYDGTQVVQNYLGSALIKVPVKAGTSEEIPLSAVWFFNGTYGEYRVDSIEANSSVTISR